METMTIRSDSTKEALSRVGKLDSGKEIHGEKGRAGGRKKEEGEGKTRCASLFAALP